MYQSTEDIQIIETMNDLHFGKDIEQRSNVCSEPCPLLISCERDFDTP
jgi:hypothetical protein